MNNELIKRGIGTEHKYIKRISTRAMSTIDSKDKLLGHNSGMFFENQIARLLTTKETAEYLRSSPKQIRKWVYQGKIKSYKLCGKSLRFKMHDLDLLLTRGDQ